MSKDMAIVVLTMGFAVAVIVFSSYVWYAMPCETIRDWNLNAPGRCIS